MNTLSEQLYSLRLLQVRITLRAKDPLQLPAYKGSTLRGGFGIAFKEAVCVVEHRDCSYCLLRSRCAFPYVFDTPVPEDATRMRKYPMAPHPFVFLPPLEEKTLYRPGETLSFNLTLIGKGGDFLPYFIYTFERLGERRGLGKGRGRFAVESVMSLCLQAVRVFGERCIPTYPVEGSERAVPLRIGSQLLESAKRDIVRQRLENYEYAAAAALLDDLGLKLQADLARLALYRLNFDFQRAKELVSILVAQDIGEVRNYGLKVETELKKLLEKNLSCLILELYHNAAIKFRKEEYLDFLGRLFRFQEAVLRYTVETSELGLQTDIDKDGRHFSTFQASVRQHQSLIDHLEQQIYKGEKLDWTEPYNPCLMAILGYLAERGEQEKRSQRADVLTRLREIEQLMSLRHKIPLGHGFEGVSGEAIHEKVAGFSPERLQDVIRDIGLLGNEGNPYDRVNALIVKTLA